MILAFVAALICHRLWTVLGRRNGEAPPARPDPFAVAPRVVGGDRIDGDRRRSPEIPAPVFNPDDPVSLEGALARVRAADAGFSEKPFLAGAKSAFQIIVGAYAAGDLARLRPLVSDDVYEAFQRGISARHAEGHTLEVQVVKVDADIDAARLTGSVARLMVAFRSTQITVLKAGDGSLVEGDAARPDDVLDLWSFARDTQSSDPNWTLVETRHQA